MSLNDHSKYFKQKQIIMLKKVLNLGNVLNKKEQRSINGGIFCMIHCLDECLASFGYDQQYGQYCTQDCQNQANQNGGGYGGF